MYPILVHNRITNAHPLTADSAWTLALEGRLHHYIGPTVSELANHTWAMGILEQLMYNQNLEKF